MTPHYVAADKKINFWVTTIRPKAAPDFSRYSLV
jgi:hypothetical protein